MPLEDVLNLLVEHLTIGAFFRARCAVGARVQCPVDVRHVLCRRLGWTRCHDTQRIATFHRRRRCVECGVRCRAKPCVCARCAAAPGSLVAMVGRGYLYAHGARRGDVVHLVPVKRSNVGAFLYWKRDADAFLGGRLSLLDA